MASAPSASALSAVLRCRGTVWSRNPPAKRPAPVKLRGDSAERGGPNRGSDKQGGLSVACRWDSGAEVCGKKANFSEVKLCVSAARPVRTGPVRPLRRVLVPSQPAAGQNFTQIPPGVLKLTVTSRFRPEIPGVGSKLKVTCCPLTCLRSGPVMFWSSCRRSGDPQRHLLEQVSATTPENT